MFRANCAAFGTAWITASGRCSVLLLLLASGSNVFADDPAVNDVQSRVTFYAMGDVPYEPAESWRLVRNSV